MPFEDKLFLIPAYTHRNAQQVLDNLSRPVNLLRLHGVLVENKTGERDVFSGRCELTVAVFYGKDPWAALPI